MIRRAVAILALVAATLAPRAAFAAFRCPAADPASTTDELALSRDDVAGPEGTVSASLQAKIKALRADGIKSGGIVDRLVVADCGLVAAEPGLSDDAKAREIRRFAAKLATVVYAGSGGREEDIMVDVPVPTSLYEKLRQAAKKAGLSEDAWINRAIAAHLEKS